MDNGKIVYMGDDSLQGAASYLGGVLTHAGFAFDYVPSSRPADPRLFDRSDGLFIVSDYPAKNLPPALQSRLAACVEKGASLLMIGGWESFHGLAGEYHRGPLADILPVTCKSSDDRVNWCQGVVPWLEMEHPSVAGLPWGEPPIFCGFNETGPREGAELVLTARPLVIRPLAMTYVETKYPLLAFGRHGKGKTAALTTDLAPHWVGGWVDWGVRRIRAQAKDGGEVEVGRHYADFITRLVGWLIG